MKIGKNLPSRAFLCALVLKTTTVFATFHEWDINEVYTNGDGTIQFIELITSVAGQGELSGHSLVSSNGTGGSQTFQFTSNLSGTTTNKTLLLGTASFASVTGLTVDYTIPANFIYLNGGTLNFGEGSSTLTYSGGQLPKNGLQSISGTGQAQTASPKTFSGLTASLSLNSYATFDEATSTMRVPVLNAPGIGIGNVNFTVNLNTLSFTLQNNFYLYGAGVSLGNTPAQFENGNTLYIPGLIFGGQLYEFRAPISSGDPIVFGSPQVIAVTTYTPPPAAPPVTPPSTPAPDQASINRGMTVFNSVCTACHGNNGGGGIGPSLISSSYNTFALLREKIDTTMPEGNSNSCRDAGSSTCATDAANYVLNVIQKSGGSSGPEEPNIGY